MNAYVDPDLCIGCTQCAGLCPAVFQMEGTLAVAQPGPIPPGGGAAGCGRSQRLPGKRDPHRGVRGKAVNRVGGFLSFLRKNPRWARFCGIMQNCVNNAMEEHDYAFTGH